MLPHYAATNDIISKGERNYLGTSNTDLMFPFCLLLWEYIGINPGNDSSEILIILIS